MSMSKKPFYYKETQGIRIVVRPVYLREQSKPARLRYIFAYLVRIENISPQTVQLLSRHWHIHDSIGEMYEVTGDGVVGEQPILAPGGVHEYQSFCVLKSPNGYMEGTYDFVGPDGMAFQAEIPRFLLIANDAIQPTA
ncbi:MAG: Co2+/Mg2+ efflux protein ApaG [Chloroflexaceae bacterium]